MPLEPWSAGLVTTLVGKDFAAHRHELYEPMKNGFRDTPMILVNTYRERLKADAWIDNGAKFSYGSRGVQEVDTFSLDLRSIFNFFKIL